MGDRTQGKSRFVEVERGQKGKGRHCPNKNMQKAWCSMACDGGWRAGARVDHHAALYKNRLFVAAICRGRHVSVVTERALQRETNRDSVLSGMPTRVEDLLVEIQRLKLHRILQSWLYAILGSKRLVTR